MRRSTKDILAGLAFLGFALLFASQMGDLEGVSLLFPQSLVIFLTIGSLLLIIKGIIDIKKNRPTENDEPVAIGRVILISIMSVAYVLLIPLLGFFPASAVFLFLAALTFSEKDKGYTRSIAVSLFFTAIFCFFVWFTFIKLLSVPTPEGILF